MKNIFKTILYFIVWTPITVIIILIGMFTVFEETGKNPFDYVRITDVDYKAVILDEGTGKILVTERLTFKIHAASRSNLFWELWRDLPEKIVDGLKVDYQVLSVKQIIAGREPIYFAESPKLYWDDRDFVNTAGGLGPGKWFHSKGPYSERLRQYECVLMYVDGLYRETVVFEIVYIMNNAVMRYGDCSELYLTLYSEDTIKYLNSFKGQILVPLDIMPRAGNYNAFTYGTNSHSFPFSESTSKNPGFHTFYFGLDESQLKFRPYNQYIEFVLLAYGPDKHLLTQNAPQNHYFTKDVLPEMNLEQLKYENLPIRFRNIKLAVFTLLVLGAALATLYVCKKDEKMRRNYTFFNSPGDIIFFRDIPSELDPNFAATLVFCRHKMKDRMTNIYSAILLSLVHKDYLRLVRFNNTKDWEPNNINMIINFNNHDLKPPSLTEAQYFNLINRHAQNGMICMKEFQWKVSCDYGYTDNFVKHIEKAITTIGVSQKYFQVADFQHPRKEIKSVALIYNIIGVLLVTVGSFASYQTRLDLIFGAPFIVAAVLFINALILRKKAKKYVLLTQFGEDEYAKWRGLYEFLNSETLMDERNVPDVVIWEQYLIYATAFGISEKVAKALAASRIDVSQSKVLNTGYYRTRHFYNHGRAFSSATRTASFTAGSGGHGGYGGGGRGGGGGGGGH